MGLARSKQSDKLLPRIRAKEFDAIATLQARWSHFKGSRPVRSYEKSRGLDKLTASERDRCIWATSLMN